MEKIIIAAVSKNNVIGKDGEIPWHYPEDLKHFKQKTMGNPVVMGSSTYESLPEEFKPLSGRKNIVLTNSGIKKDESVAVANSLDEAWDIAEEHSEKAFIIGGASIYKQTLKQADKMVITRINEKYDGDTYFPEWKEKNWKEIKREERDNLSFIEYSRVT